MNASIKTELLAKIDARFISGNSVPVERTHITAREWNELRALANRPDAQGGWRPIDSAPRDGTWILGSHIGWTDGQECPPIVCYWQGGDENQNGWFGEGAGYFSPQPNLWMPLTTLPAPPAGEHQ